MNVWRTPRLRSWLGHPSLASPLTVLLAILLVVPKALAAAPGTELVCPCGVHAVDQTAVGAVFGVRSTNPEAGSGSLLLTISALTDQDVQHGLLGQRIAELHLEPVAPGAERARQTYVTGLVVDQKPDPAGLRMVLWEDGEMVDSVRMVGTASFGFEGGAAEETARYGVGGLHIRGEVTGDFEGPTVSATLPMLVNTSLATADDLMVRVYATGEPTLYTNYHLVYQEDLGEDIAPGESVENVAISGDRLGTPPAGFDYYHVAIVKAPPPGGNATGWQTLYVWQTAEADGVPRREFSLPGLDTLTDTDGDGVSDFNEARFPDADPRDPTKRPPASTVKLLVLYTSDAAFVYGSDIFDIIDEEIAAAQRVFDESGVAVRLDLAGTQTVDGVGAVAGLAPLAVARKPPFEDLDAALARYKADIPVIAQLNNRFVQYCGATETRGISHRGDFVGRDGVAAVHLLCNPHALAHELGHVMGLSHSRRDGGGTFSWSVGHGAEGGFATVMAEATFPDARHTGLFSSPTLLCGDAMPCGVDRTDPILGADAVTTLETTRFQVAAFAGAEPPVIVLAGGSPYYTPLNGPFVEPGFAVEDDGDSGLESAVTTAGVVDTGTLGSYELTYTVVDTDGNVGRTTRTVVVTVDTDADGRADPIDRDDDGDGLSDDYERAHGFDPLVHDAHDDADGDGITNASEYRAGTSPLDATDLPVRNRLVPLLPRATADREGFVRLFNHSNRAGDVTVQVVEDGGTRFEPFTLRLEALTTLHFNSHDLEAGNPAKGLAVGVGPGGGDWRLEVSSDLDIEMHAYVRTTDGFLGALQGPAPRVSRTHRVPLFNPGSNIEVSSRLRLLNPGGRNADVTIRGIDDAGNEPGSAVRLTLAGGAVRVLTASALESGEGLEGALGFGEGRWQLDIDATMPIMAMNLLEGVAGRLTSLPFSAPTSNPLVVPFVPSPHGRRQGFVRLTNRAELPTDVLIYAIDDDGRRSYSWLLDMAAGRTVEISSTELQDGEPSIGLIGVGRLGDMRLEVGSEPMVEVHAYARTRHGFLTSLQTPVTRNANGYRIPTFNPARNASQRSYLRLVNLSDAAGEVWIQGIDDDGRVRGTDVRVEMAALETRTLTAAELEAGGERIEGALGAGKGKWRLMVASERPLMVLNLLASPSGYLANLAIDPCNPNAPTVASAEPWCRRHP